MIESLPPYTYVLVAALVTPFVSRRSGHLVGAVALAVALLTAGMVPDGVHLTGSLFGFETVFYRADTVTRLMGLIFAFIGLVAVVYAWASQASRTHTAFALGYVGTSLGAVFVGDWLTLVVFWELMAITSTLLVWEDGPAAVRPGFRYALLHGLGGSLLLVAIAWQYARIGSFAFDAGMGIEGAVPGLLAALGIGVNVGFIGLHAWLPDTYPRPHVAASVFLCVFTTKTGVYAMFRAFPEGHLWLAYMGGAMAVFGAFVALLQHDMRRLLSYHIQSQVGYMVAGIGIGGALATAGAFGHVFNHILYKSLLFMAIGVVIYRTGQERLDDVGGLWRSMPITAVCFGIAAASIAGVPGFNGFVSKGMVIEAAHYDHLDVLWGLLLLGGIGTFLSFIKLGYYTFVAGSYDGEVRDANRGQSVALVSVAALCVLFGLVPGALVSILPDGGGLDYVTYTLGHVGEGIALGVIAAVAFVFVRGWLLRVSHIPDVDAIYNPVVFYGIRALARGITNGFAAVDRIVVRTGRSVTDIVMHPERIAGVVGPSSGQPRSLRAGLGRSVLLLVGVMLSLIWLALIL